VGVEGVDECGRCMRMSRRRRSKKLVPRNDALEFTYDDRNNSVSVSCMMLIDSATLLELIY
jgi:hypothetical protein